MSSPVTVLGYDGSALSAPAAAALAAADLVVGGRRHLDAVTVPSGADTVVMGALAPALDAIRGALQAEQKVVVLASGDPGLFGIVRALRSLDLLVSVVPATSSMAAALSRLGLPWDDAVVVSAHGRPLAPALNVLRRFGGTQQPVVVLTDEHSSPARILEALGEDCPPLHVFERLGEDDETVTEIGPRTPDRSELVSREWRSPNLVVAAGAATGRAPWLLGRQGLEGGGPDGWALPDDAFAHRDGMLTKRDVRAAVLARLAPRVGTLVWDIGAGSGSVGIECSRLGAAVVCVERGDVEHLRTNALALHGPVRIVQGDAPAALEGLPHPDAVFVGGGGPDVVSAVAAVRPPRVVVALATLERVAPTVAALEGYDVETVLLQVSHLQPLGEGHRLVPANPVFVVSGVLP